MTEIQDAPSGAAVAERRSPREPLLRVEGLTKYFPVRAKLFRSASGAASRS